MRRSSCSDYISYFQTTRDATAGTEAELAGPSGEDLHKQMLAHMQQHPDVWPQGIHSLRDFQYAAGMVQSRTFHMRQYNWLTGSSTEGEPALVCNQAITDPI